MYPPWAHPLAPLEHRKEHALTPFAPLDQSRAYRSALGRYPTGVTIVTAFEDGVPIGMTANSFTSVSLLPPLILWSPAKASARHDVFVNTDAFNIHILTAKQLDLAIAFTKSKHSFEHCQLKHETKQAPLIAECLVAFECHKHATYEAGDHTLILGEVAKVHQGEGTPLTFQDGKFIPA